MIGDNIKATLKDKSMTAYKLARDSGVSDSYLSEIINGKKQNPSMKIVKKIATSLGVTLDDLTSEKGVI